METIVEGTFKSSVFASFTDFEIRRERLPILVNLETSKTREAFQNKAGGLWVDP